MQSPTIVPVENFKVSERNISQIEMLDSLKQKHIYLLKTNGMQTEVTEVK
ncbi:hypothetical protein [Chryseobacterium sp. CFBP8996]|nr:hypothetical protein [Chryseobacterium sp. CFBP8996]MDY0932448.1 hypothetical protein [Chryseobacterium sp. CFBP8996]